MPSSDAQTIVLTINTGSVGSSGSLGIQSKQTPLDTTKEPINSKETIVTKKNQPVKTETQTPKVLQTKPNQKATIATPDQTPSRTDSTNSKVSETSKSQAKETQKNTQSDSQGDSTYPGKQGGSGSQQGNSTTGSGNSSQGNQGVGQSSGGGNGKITPPIPTYAPEPPYPSAAEKLQQLGTVHISLKIDAAGKVTDTNVTRSSQFPLLDNAAKRALKSWRFKAAQQEGNAIPATVNIKILFTPEGVKVSLKDTQ